MMVCDLCQKGKQKVSVSRHKKGASGASKWPMRAPITKKTQRPNLHTFKGMTLCTKCLRLVKESVSAKRPVKVRETSSALA